MSQYEQKLKQYVDGHSIQAEHRSFEQSCHTVAEAARAVGASPEDFVKNICLIASDGALAVAIVKGEDRVSASRVAAALGVRSARLATPDEILARTGYPCGGTPSFGYEATVLIDPQVMEKEVVWTGGGSETSLVKIGTRELLRASRGTIARLRK